MHKVKYFYNEEEKYEAWLDENREIGFVVNNYQDKDRKTIHPNGLKLHKATCNTLNQPSHVEGGRRTKSYGKLCGLDELALIEDCELKNDRRPKRCSLSGRNCFK